MNKKLSYCERRVMSEGWSCSKGKPTKWKCRNALATRAVDVGAGLMSAGNTRVEEAPK